MKLRPQVRLSIQKGTYDNRVAVYKNGIFSETESCYSDDLLDCFTTREVMAEEYSAKGYAVRLTKSVTKANF